MLKARMANPATLAPGAMQALIAPGESTEHAVPAHLRASQRDVRPQAAGNDAGKRRIAYWATTVMVAIALGGGGVADVLRLDVVANGMAHLGYPGYFTVLIGVWKLLGVAALLAPGLPRLKEWAYAGAVVSHIASGDPAAKVIAPAVLTGLAIASWALRPATRRLG